MLGPLLSCHVDDRHIVWHSGGLEMYDFSLLSCLFAALPLRWLHTSGPEERACVSVTADPHSHMSLLGCEGVFGVSRTNTHTAHCFHH